MQSNGDTDKALWDRKYEEGLPSLTKPDPFFVSAYERHVDRSFPNAGRRWTLRPGSEDMRCGWRTEGWQVSAVDVSEVAIGKLCANLRAGREMGKRAPTRPAVTRSAASAARSRRTWCAWHPPAKVTQGRSAFRGAFASQLRDRARRAAAFSVIRPRAQRGQGRKQQCGGGIPLGRPWLPIQPLPSARAGLTRAETT